MEKEPWEEKGGGKKGRKQLSCKCFDTEYIVCSYICQNNSPELVLLSKHSIKEPETFIV